MDILDDLKSGERRKIDKEIDSGARRLGVEDDWDGFRQKDVFSKEDFGICYDCKELRACRTRYGKVLAKCYEFDITMNGTDPIMECSCYKRRGEMTLFEMKDMAIIIETNKRQAGFIIEE
jgi:hypothetical protein